MPRMMCAARVGWRDGGGGGEVGGAEPVTAVGELTGRYPGPVADPPVRRRASR